VSICYSAASMALSHRLSWRLASNGIVLTSLQALGSRLLLRDAPSAWPPHQYIVLKALAALPSNVSNSPLPTNASFSLVPTGQLGLEEASLPGQPVAAGKNATKSGAQADVSRSGTTFLNGGNATDGEGWAKTLERALANRYTTSAFCSWRATGGSLPDVLPKLSNEELNVTQSINNTGNMFEKFSVTDVNSAGRGGEYTVQAGFGWTNGVLLWVASTYGKEVRSPPYSMCLGPNSIIARFTLLPQSSHDERH
jgi:alpha,alpha-trehalase